jgi:hypothetical protein
MRLIIALLLFLVLPFAALSQTKVKLSDLQKHIGDSVIVEGPVKTITHRDSSSLNSSILLTIGNGTNSLTVIIDNSVKNRFTVKPEEAYKNKSIRVSGKLQNANGKMQILISDPSQIVLIDHK